MKINKDLNREVRGVDEKNRGRGSWSRQGKENLAWM